MGEKMCPVCGGTYGLDIGFCARDGARLIGEGLAREVLADRDPLVRTLIAGRYRVLKRIGEGGMGVVYLAEHEAIEKRVAIKILKEQYAQREDVVARFQQEAKSASRVQHEAVLEIFDFGRTEDGRFFLAMELLDGFDLAHVLERERAFDPVRAVRIIVHVALALAAAHAKGIIHRDMKPENVFVRVGEDGRESIKIVDFGIAQLRADGEQASDPQAKVSGRKLTKTGMIFGTPEYMSPEQASGRPIDLRVDVYAVGIMLFELITGRTPYQGETFLGILTSHLAEPIPRLSAFAAMPCSRELEAVVDKALAKNPDERFRSMGELVEALAATPEGQSDDALRRSLPRSPSEFPLGVRPPAMGFPATDWLLRPAGQPMAPTVLDASSMSSAPPPGGHPGAVAAFGSKPPDRQAGTPDATSVAPVREAEPRGRLRVGAIVALGCLGLGSAAIWFAVGAKNAMRGRDVSVETSASSTDRARSAGAFEAPSVGSASAPTPASVTAPTPASSDAGTDAVPAAAEEQVTIRVETTPPGALIERELGADWVQLCDRSPCEIQLPRGAMVQLRATKGRVVGTRKISAHAAQKVSIVLPVSPAPNPTIATRKKGADGQDYCEVLMGEGDEAIKVWRPCK